MKRYLWLFVIIFGVLCNRLFADPMSGELLYQKGDYTQAKQVYQSLLDQHPTDSGLMYNLGCVYFKQGEFGEALVYFLRAKKLDARNSDIEFNCKQIEVRLQDRFIVSPFSVFFLKKLTGFVTLDESIFLFSLPFLSCMGVMCVFLFKRKSLIESSLFFILTGFFSIVLGLFLFLKATADIWTDFGVVIESKVVLKSGPSDGLTTQGFVHEGTQVRIKRHRNGWSEVELPNGVSGWIQTSSYWLL